MQVKKEQLELDMEQQTGSKSGKGCILSPCLFNLYTDYIMWNATQDEAQAGIKIAGRNINNLRYADGITLMAESEEELKSLLIRMKEENKKAGLKLNIRDFPGALVAKTLHSQCKGSGFDPWSGN